MPVQAHVVVQAMQQKQGRDGAWWTPQLADDLVTPDIHAPQRTVDRPVAPETAQTVEALIGLRFQRQRLFSDQGLQAGSQVVGVTSQAWGFQKRTGATADSSNAMNLLCDIHLSGRAWQ